MEENRDIFIYSLNKIAYLQSRGIFVEIRQEVETGKFFGIFKSTPESRQVIAEYKADKGLHSFLNQFKAIKQAIAEHR
jgi:hypothetical protein